MTKVEAKQKPKAEAATYKWAFIAEDGTYKGGVVAEEAPTEETGLPAGTQAIQVSRFPAPYETWDFAQNKWSEDSAVRAMREELAEIQGANNEELVRLTEQRVQEWLLEVLPQLVPGLQISQQQVGTLFPLARKK